MTRRGARDGGRLVVVSNRVTSPRDKARAGGLAVAVLDTLRSRGGLWFGWSGNVVTEGAEQLSVETHGRVSLAVMDLTTAQYEHYYNGFANRSLWPLFHYRVDLASFDAKYYQMYLRVNLGFARAVRKLIVPDDTIWVHDYHLFSFGEELRRMGVRNRIGFFLHIPFPAPEVLSVLPSALALVRALFAYDLVGFQTESDRQCFIKFVVEEAQGELLDDGRVRAFGTTTLPAVFPIGIDAKNFTRLTRTREAERHMERLGRVLAGRAQILGVERLDYTKGIPERFKAFEELLANYPENRGRLSLMQIAPPSRSEVSEYQEIRHTMETLAGHINGRFAEYDWTPIRYLNRAFSRQALAGLYRASRIGLVTPLRDGMNLVAKEYVASQDESEPGVLVLSRFAGAAKQLRDALIVNPYDTHGVAEALQRAINMPIEERRNRLRTLQENVLREDIDHWASSFLETLEHAPVR